MWCLLLLFNIECNKWTSWTHKNYKEGLPTVTIYFPNIPWQGKLTDLRLTHYQETWRSPQKTITEKRVDILSYSLSPLKVHGSPWPPQRRPWHPSIAEWGKTWGSEWVHFVFETHRGQNYNSHGYTFHLSTCIPGIRTGRQWDGGMDECQKVILGTCVAGLTAVPMVLPFNTVQCHGHWLYVAIWD